MKTTLQIQNLKCNGCASTIKNKLSTLGNIEKISIELESSSVSFDHKSDEDLEVVKKELNDLGYPLAGKQNKLQTKAKSYVSCAIGKMNS